MEKLQNLTWLKAESIETIIWFWLGCGVVVILERLILFATYNTKGLINLPLLGGLRKISALSPSKQTKAIRLLMHREINAWQKFFDYFGEISSGLGMTGTLLALMQSKAFQAGDTQLLGQLATAMRTTVLGVTSGIVVSTCFGKMIWPNLKEKLLYQWNRRLKILQANLKCQDKIKKGDIHEPAGPNTNGRLPMPYHVLPVSPRAGGTGKQRSGNNSSANGNGRCKSCAPCQSGG